MPRPGSRRRALESPAVSGPRRAAAAGHEAWRLAAPRWPGPRRHHDRPQLARLWGTQSVTERAPGGARPRASPPFLGPGTRARHNKATFVPPLQQLMDSPTYGVQERRASRDPEEGRGREEADARTVGKGFSRPRPGFPRVSPRSPWTSGVHRFQRRRPVLSADLQSHFFTARCVEWSGAPMATLDLPLALPHVVSPPLEPEAAAAGGSACSDPGWWPGRAMFSVGAAFLA